MPNTTYPALFSPATLGPRTARNRIWMTAHATEFATDGTFADASAEYYAERARGGVGVVTMEAMAVHPTSQPRRGVILAYDERVVTSYQKVAAAVRPHGALLIAQLWHRGRQTDGMVSRLPTWAPSAVPDVVYRETPHAMTTPDIDDLVAHYVLAARYAVAGDVDGVEIHGAAHGYLLGQFLSPATNHRTDEYGGSLENRLRVLRRIVDEVRDAVPADRIAGIRINGDDGPVEGGLGNAEWAEIAGLIAAWGKLDYISVSQGTYLDRMQIYGTSAARPAGFEVAATANIKQAAGSLPVVAVGRITTPEMAEEIVSAGKADFAGMARQLIADPMWAQKSRQGRRDDIRPCVGANWCIAAQNRTSLECVHNPAVGREKQFRDMPPAVRARRVAVAGGGPAGLRAALTAAERGHDVTLFERSGALGGQVSLITRAPSYREWSGITDWLVSQLQKTGVKIKLGYEASAAELAREFDAVVAATGSVPVRHGWTAAHPARWAPSAAPLPGSDQWNVYTPFDILGGGTDLPRRLLIIDDLGDRQAFVIAEYLAERRHDVRVVSAYPEVGHLVAWSHDLGFAYGALRQRGVTFRPNTEVTAIDGDQVTLTDVHNREESRLEADGVVLVLGNKADDTLARELGATGTEVLMVGDCQAPRRIFNAIWEGEMAGRSL